MPGKPRPDETVLELTYCPRERDMFGEPRFPVLLYTRVRKDDTMLTPENLRTDTAVCYSCSCRGKMHLKSSGRNVDVSFKDTGEDPEMREHGVMCLCHVSTKEKGLGRKEIRELTDQFEPRQG